MKLSLSEVTTKINMTEYSFSEYVDFLMTFKNKQLVIETDELDPVVVNLNPSYFPHLMGINYCFNKRTEKQYYMGEAGLIHLKSGNVSLSSLENGFRKNYTGNNLTWSRHILPRIEYLPSILNTLTKGNNHYLSENGNPHSSLKGKLFFFKIDNRISLMLSLIQTGKSYGIESLLVDDFWDYFDINNNYKITNLYII